MGLIREYGCDVCETTAPAAVEIPDGQQRVLGPSETELPLHFMRVQVRRSTGEPEVEADVDVTVCSYDCAQTAIADAKKETAAARAALTRAANAEAEELG